MNDTNNLKFLLAGANIHPLLNLTTIFKTFFGSYKHSTLKDIKVNPLENTLSLKILIPATNKTKDQSV